MWVLLYHITYMTCFFWVSITQKPYTSVNPPLTGTLHERKYPVDQVYYIIVYNDYFPEPCTTIKALVIASVRVLLLH